MRTLRRFVDQDELSTAVQRIGTAGVGLLLWWFGVVAFSDHVRFFTTQPAPAPSIGGNGLLAALCLLCGASLIVAAIRGGVTTTSTATAVGLGYLVLAFASLFVFTSNANVFAVTLPDALLGVVAGFVLLALGVRGRPVAVATRWRTPPRPDLPKQRRAARS
jgi:hypothetical protein